MSNPTLSSNPRVLMRGDASNKPLLIATLLGTGLWDHLAPADREAWTERCEILDTPGGRLLQQVVVQSGAAHG